MMFGSFPEEIFQNTVSQRIFAIGKFPRTTVWTVSEGYFARRQVPRVEFLLLGKQPSGKLAFWETGLLGNLPSGKLVVLGKILWEVTSGKVPNTFATPTPFWSGACMLGASVVAQLLDPHSFHSSILTRRS